MSLEDHSPRQLPLQHYKIFEDIQDHLRMFGDDDIFFPALTSDAPVTFSAACRQAFNLRNSGLNLVVVEADDIRKRRDRFLFEDFTDEEIELVLTERSNPREMAISCDQVYIPADPITDEYGFLEYPTRQEFLLRARRLVTGRFNNDGVGAKVLNFADSVAVRDQYYRTWEQSVLRNNIVVVTSTDLPSGQCVVLRDNNIDGRIRVGKQFPNFATAETRALLALEPHFDFSQVG